MLQDLVGGAAQLLLTTHPPVLAALPGAPGGGRAVGMREAAWDDLELTADCC